MERAYEASGRKRCAVLLDLPTHEATLLRHYTLSDDDIEQIRVWHGSTISWVSIFPPICWRPFLPIALPVFTAKGSATSPTGCATCQVIGVSAIRRSALSRRRSRFTPVRVNLLVIALLIALLNGGIVCLVYLAITSKEISEFVTGALVGLLPVGITALSSLGTTLMNDK